MDINKLLCAVVVKSTTPPPTTTTTTTTTSTTTTWLSSTTTTPLAPTPAGESHFFLFIGLFILFSILFVGFALVGLALKTRWDRYRHHMMPLYQFDPDQDDLEAELLESPERSRLDTSRSRRDFGTCQKAAPPPPQLDLMN